MGPRGAFRRRLIDYRLTALRVTTERPSDQRWPRRIARTVAVVYWPPGRSRVLHPPSVPVRSTPPPDKSERSVTLVACRCLRSGETGEQAALEMDLGHLPTSRHGW